jgi:uncharacterized protein (TIGR03437 family)
MRASIVSPPIALAIGLALAVSAHAQVSPTAYRVLGQANLQANGLNMVQGVELHVPFGVALDARGGQTHLYISDTGNSRILAWADVSSYQIGAAPGLILAQPGPQYSGALGIGAEGLNEPLGLAVDPTTGNLYVADFGDNRVLRFPSPFNNPSQVQPDAVYGQPNFTTLTAGAVANNSLNSPRAVAFDQAGNLWVSDSGNNRVLRFNASVLNQTTPAPTADTVIGHANFTSGSANGGGSVSASGLNTPAGLAFDPQGNLYVADLGNNRVLRFSTPLGPPASAASATAVWGQANFATGSVASQASAGSMNSPAGVSVDSNGNLYVAVPNDNRVLQFSTATTLGGSAKNVWGQSDFVTTSANTGSFPLASATGLSGPEDVKLDANGDIFVADTGNNRVLEFPVNARTANLVWGQNDFTSNGPNQIKPGSINYPFQMAIDYSQSPFALYVSDTGNNRVLVWKDSVHFTNGQPADLVIGQPSLLTGAANVDTQGSTTVASSTSLSAPAGIAVTANGTVYVADSGNNRVLRYPRPVNQTGRIAPDAAIGQTNFTSTLSALVNSSSLNTPGGLAIGPNGDLFVADSGNNRVLEFAAGAGTGASAMRVYGQPGMNSSLRPSQFSAQTLAGPQGLAVDPGSNLYVADTGANRVVVFPDTQNAPSAGMVATYVIGPSGFGNTASTLKAPVAVAPDSNGNIYVADNGDNRVLMYPSLVFLPVAGATASAVVGQQTTSGTSVNWDSPNGQATADSLWAPVGIYVDRQNTLYVGDTGNNRVLQFLNPATVVNAATFQATVPVGQGSLATLFGSGLVANQATATSSGTTWPTAVLDRQVVVNNQTVSPIYFIGPSQINFQVPSAAPVGTQQIAVRLADTQELVAGGTLLVQAAAPGIFTSNSQGTGQAAVVNQDGTINSASNPASVGSTISLYGTGQGQVSPTVPDGTAAPSTLSFTVAVPTSNGTTCIGSPNSMCVAMGSGTGAMFGAVSFSGLAPGFIGLWQINVALPQGVTTGAAVPLAVVIDGSKSNLVTVAIR